MLHPKQELYDVDFISNGNNIINEWALELFNQRKMKDGAQK